MLENLLGPDLFLHVMHFISCCPLSRWVCKSSLCDWWTAEANCYDFLHRCAPLYGEFKTNRKLLNHHWFSLDSTFAYKCFLWWGWFLLISNKCVNSISLEKRCTIIILFPSSQIKLSPLYLQVTWGRHQMTGPPTFNLTKKESFSSQWNLTLFRTPSICCKKQSTSLHNHICGGQCINLAPNLLCLSNDRIFWQIRLRMW